MSDEKLRRENEVMKDILISVLSCGYADLSVITDCKYDIEELMEEVENMGYEKPDLNNLAKAMFYKGIYEIESFIENNKDEILDDIDEKNAGIEDRMDELENDDEEFENDELWNKLDEEQADLKTKKEDIESLEPIDDIESYHNYLDTSIYFLKNQEIYQKYFQEALDEFEENTGFAIN